ncbi:hypothetical protein [Kribbella sp. NPDC049227]|uniref:hypothetical protein n=1 Tax=Kribbella sp. NPDC049227 TaxID=3364113 RepID=UPI00371ACA27
MSLRTLTAHSRSRGVHSPVQGALDWAYAETARRRCGPAELTETEADEVAERVAAYIGGMRRSVRTVLDVIAT